MPSSDSDNKSDASSDPTSRPNTRNAPTMPAPYVKSGSNPDPEKPLGSDELKYLGSVGVLAVWAMCRPQTRCEATPEQLTNARIKMRDYDDGGSYVDEIRLTEEGARIALTAAVEAGFLRMTPGAKAPNFEITELGMPFTRTEIIDGLLDSTPRSTVRRDDQQKRRKKQQQKKLARRRSRKGGR